MDKLYLYFHYLVHCNIYYKEKFDNGLEFLKTLNLSDEQYKQLGKLMELYGEEQYQSCEDRHIDDEAY